MTVVGACLTAQWVAVRLPWAASRERLKHPSACLTARVAAQCWALSTACKCGRPSPEVRSHRRPRAPRRVPQCPCSEAACLGARRPLPTGCPRPHAAHRSGRAVGGRALTRRPRPRARQTPWWASPLRSSSSCTGCRAAAPGESGRRSRPSSSSGARLAHPNPGPLPQRSLSAWVPPLVIDLWCMCGLPPPARENARGASARESPRRLQRVVIPAHSVPRCALGY